MNPEQPRYITLDHGFKVCLWHRVALHHGLCPLCWVSIRRESAEREARAAIQVPASQPHARAPLVSG